MKGIQTRQYEMAELCFTGKKPAGSEVEVDLEAVFVHDGTSTAVKGFYAGNSTYKVRFLPEFSGEYHYTVKGSVLEAPVEGVLKVESAAEGRHGPVRAEGTHLRCADGAYFYSFGTTIYALAHQSEALIEEKNVLYGQYREQQSRTRELQTVRDNLYHTLGRQAENAREVGR